MSIEISSEDSNSSTDHLPAIGLPCSNGSFGLSNKSISTSSTENNDNCVDLTQEDVQTKLDNLDHGKNQRPSTPHSDSTVDLQPDDIDNDEIFDQMFPDTPRKRLNGDSAHSSQSVASVRHYDSVSSSKSVASLSSACTTSSGYVSGDNGTKRRKSVDSSNNGNATKQSKAAERANKKQKIAEERRARQMASEVNKIYKPGECTKYMNIEAHPALLSQWFMADLSRETEGLGARVVPSPDLYHTGLITWSRRVQRTFHNGDGQAHLSSPSEPCSQCLLVLTAEEAAPLVTSHTMTSHVAEVRSVVDAQLTLLVFGVRDYYKSKRTNPKHGGKFNELELEMAFTDLLVSTSCDALTVDSPSELAITIAQMTKAIAEAPHKLSKRSYDEQAEFYMRGDNKKCVSVDKDGRGCKRLWQQMVALLPRCSLDAARAIALKYDSPLTMYESLRQPNGVNELADVAPAGRRLGREAAGRLHALFTATDGDMLVE